MARNNVAQLKKQSKEIEGLLGELEKYYKRTVDKYERMLDDLDKQIQQAEGGEADKPAARKTGTSAPRNTSRSKTRSKPVTSTKPAKAKARKSRTKGGPVAEE